MPEVLISKTGTPVSSEIPSFTVGNLPPSQHANHAGNSDKSLDDLDSEDDKDVPRRISEELSNVLKNPCFLRQAPIVTRTKLSYTKNVCLFKTRRVFFGYD